MKYIYALLFLAALPFQACVGGDDDTPEIENYVVEGNPVPAFTVKDADGENVSFAPEWFVGKKTMIVFFVSGCGDCAREKKKIDPAWEALKNDMEFITIHRGVPSPKEIQPKKYWADKDLPWYLDPSKETFLKFANSTVPRFYLVGEDGLVKWMCVENLEKAGIKNGEEFIETIKKKLEI